jgi:TRAP-type C4-dicarboxylate transport system permease small subunit
LSLGVIVFFDVVHRVFTRTPGRISVMLAGITGAAAESLDEVVSPALISVSLFAVVILAVRTRSRDIPLGRAALIAAVLSASMIMVVQVFIRVMPEGIVWAPYLSLCLLLWSGLIGASMATHANSHLALEVGEKLWPAGVRPFVRGLARITAGLFSLMIAVLAAMSTIDHLQLWLETPQAALIPAVDLPKWLVFLVVPYAFGMMGLRFLAHSTGWITPPPQEGPS